MKRSLSALAVVASLAFGLGLAGQTGSASAMSAAGTARATVPVQTTASVEQVNHRDWHRRDYQRRHWRDDRRGWDRRWDRRHYQPRSGFYLEFNVPQQRRYVQPQPPRHYRVSQAHINWCYARYRSYRAWDNSFQPYYGPRRQCLSPYG